MATTANQVSNDWIAERLEEIAKLLEQQGANPFRGQAYRNAAATVRDHPRPVADVLAAEGRGGLDALPAIGPAIAGAIGDLVAHGRLPLLERLRTRHDPIANLRTVAGVGPVLARRLNEELGIDSLEQLEMAAHDGTLERAGGFGAKRIAGIQEALAARLGRRRSTFVADDEPDVGELLDVDREYREESRAHRLPAIAPRRFNPRHEAWLPVLHTSRGERHYTALYSNTARAHQLGKTHDWVVLYFDDGGGRERQCTVVTARGRRVVRGRERECAALRIQG